MVLTEVSSNFSVPMRALAAELETVLVRSPFGPVRSLRQQQTRLDPDEVFELLQDYANGLTAKDLSVKYGVHRRTIANHLHKSGLPLRQPGLSEIQMPEIMRLYLEGWSLARLGERFYCDPGTVRRYLLLAGVPTRRPWERI